MSLTNDPDSGETPLVRVPGGVSSVMEGRQVKAMFPVPDEVCPADGGTLEALTLWVSDDTMHGTWETLCVMCRERYLVPVTP